MYQNKWLQRHKHSKVPQILKALQKFEDTTYKIPFDTIGFESPEYAPMPGEQMMT